MPSFVPPLIHPVRACLSPSSAIDNLRIVVTAPAPYAARLVPLLIQQHAKPIWMPSIHTTSLTDDDDIDNLRDALFQLPSFQVLAFTSRTGMTELSRYLRDISEDAEAAELLLRASGIKIAALGKDATAAKEVLGVTADIVPLEASPLGLVRFLAADPALYGAPVLCPVPKVMGMTEPSVVPDFLAALEEKGFRPTALPAYETKPAKRDEIEYEVEMLLNGRADAIIFSSAGEAWGLREVLTENERKALAGMKIVLAAHGPFAAKGVREALEVDNVVVSGNFSTFDGVIGALEETFKERYRENPQLVLPA